MPARERSTDRGRRLARRSVSEIVADLRATRLTLGIAQRQIADAMGVSRSYVGRLERDEIGAPAIEDLAAFAAALGLRLRVALYPDGEPIRDRVQLRLLDALRARLAPSTGWLTEVPLPVAGDRRAWDAVAASADGRTGIEGISRLGAVDATLRSANQKQRDDPRIARTILLIADTRRNREALRTAWTSIRADFPLGTRDVLAALAAGRVPAANGVALVRVPGDRRPQVVHTGGKLVDVRTAARPGFVENPVGAAPAAPLP